MVVVVVMVEVVVVDWMVVGRRMDVFTILFYSFALLTFFLAFPRFSSLFLAFLLLIFYSLLTLPLLRYPSILPYLIPPYSTPSVH